MVVYNFVAGLAVLCYTVSAARTDTQTELSACDCNAAQDEFESLKRMVGDVTLRDAEREQESKAEMEALNARLAKMEAMLTTGELPNKRPERMLQDDVMTSPASSSAPVPAFSARIGAHHQTQLTINQPIIFDLILTNEGDNYSDVTGVFTAPSDGLYLFTGSIVSHSRDGLETGMTVNGANNIALLYAKDSDQHDQGSNTAIVRLVAGDEVWMHLNGQNGDKIFGFGWSTFSGFRIGD